MTNDIKRNPINKPIQDIWDKTRNNPKLRHGERHAIFKSLKEIQFMWGFSE